MIRQSNFKPTVTRVTLLMLAACGAGFTSNALASQHAAADKVATGENASLAQSERSQALTGSRIKRLNKVVLDSGANKRPKGIARTGSRIKRLQDVAVDATARKAVVAESAETLDAELAALLRAAEDAENGS